MQHHLMDLRLKNVYQPREALEPFSHAENADLAVLEDESVMPALGYRPPAQFEEMTDLRCDEHFECS